MVGADPLGLSNQSGLWPSTSIFFLMAATGTPASCILKYPCRRGCWRIVIAPGPPAMGGGGGGGTNPGGGAPGRGGGPWGALMGATPGGGGGIFDPGGGGGPPGPPPKPFIIGGWTPFPGVGSPAICMGGGPEVMAGAELEEGLSELLGCGPPPLSMESNLYSRRTTCASTRSSCLCTDKILLSQVALNRFMN